MELFDIATSLRRQLFGSREELEELPLFKANSTLLDRLISKLTYCIRDEPVRYMAVDLTSPLPEGNAESFRVAVYTDDHLFHLAYDPQVDHIVTTIIARSTIRRIEVLAAPIVTIPEETSHGPVDVAVYYDYFTVRLPGDNRATDRNRELLDSFILALEKDLIAA